MRKQLKTPQEFIEYGCLDCGAQDKDTELVPCPNHICNWYFCKYCAIHHEWECASPYHFMTTDAEEFYAEAEEEE